MAGLILLFVTAFILIALIGSAAVVWAIVRPRRKTYAVALALGLPTDPADIERVAEEVAFNLPGNHTTPGWIITGDNPAGPTILILHGHGDSRYGALLRAKELAPYAGHLVVFDWPAHGECTAPWMTCGKRESADVIAVLEGLPDALRNQPIALFGYSLGGQIAIKTAGEHPRFAGVIADGPYRRWDTPIRQKLKHYRVPALPFIPIVGVFFWLTNLIRLFDRVKYAQRIEVPLLVLHGTDDRICPLHEGRELAEHAPLGRFVAIEEGRHNLLHEHEPAAYHAALKQFFETISPSSQQNQGN